MKKIIDFILKLFRFFCYDIWRITEGEVTSKKHILYNVIKVLYLSIRGFLQDKLSTKASALTYYTLLSIVPILAVIVGVGKGFDVQYYVENQFIKIFPGQEDVLKQTFDLVDSYLQQITGGWFVGIGIIVLFWSVLNVFSQIENAFNDIWEVKKSRSTVRRFTDYFSMTLVVPILLVVSNGISIYINSNISDLYFSDVIAPVWGVFLKFLPFIINMGLFVLIYMIFPNTKVRFDCALFGGIVAGILFQVFQSLYINGQIWVSRYNAIYGSFAALPLLLLWLQLSWIIILYGAKLSFAAQNVRNYEFESDIKLITPRYQNFLYILISSVIVKRFADNQEPFSRQKIALEYKIPIQLVNRTIDKLIEANIISEMLSQKVMDEKVYQPAMDINKLTVAFLFDKIDTFGSENFKIDTQSRHFKQWQALISTQKKSEDYSSTVLLRDLVD